jgi:hypothetical protein
MMMMTHNGRPRIDGQTKAVFISLWHYQDETDNNKESPNHATIMALPA